MMDVKRSHLLNTLMHLAQQQSMDPPALTRALELLPQRPEKNEWKGLLDSLFLLLGIGFLASGILFFFAYNWESLNKFVKFGILEAGIILSILPVLVKKLDSKIAKAGLFLAILLIGVLLAVFGQIYQTGADAYQLFAGWVALVAGWVLISNFLPLWAFFILLLNTTLILYWDQMVDAGIVTTLQLLNLLILLNSLLLVTFEYLQAKKLPWLDGRWFHRFLLLLIAIPVTLSTLLFIHEETKQQVLPFLLLLAPLIFVLFLGALIPIYLKIKQDLFFITIALLSTIIVITAFLSANYFKDSDQFLILSFIVIVQGGLAASWLNKIHSKWAGEK